MTDCSLPDAWTERTFERGAYGPANRAGIVARFAAASGDAVLELTPVRYERRDGRDRFSSHVDEFDHEAGTLAIRGPTEIPRRTAFAVRARFSPLARDREVVFAAPWDAEDALAVALTLARNCPDGRALRDAVQAHGGAGGGVPSLSDEEVLDATLADEADRCLFDGVPTSSHGLRLPLRYAVRTADYPHTDVGVPRIPTLFARFEAVVSHAAWTDHSLSAPDLAAPIERRGPGAYSLPDGDAVADGTAAHLTLLRHGDVDPR